VVGTAGGVAGVDRTGQAAAKRASRAHASHAQSRDDAPAGGQLSGAAAQVQSLPRGVQRRTAARGPGHAHAVLALRLLATGDADEAAAARVPGSVRGALRERQRRHSLEESHLGSCSPLFERVSDTALNVERAEGRPASASRTQATHPPPPADPDPSTARPPPRRESLPPRG